MSSDKTEDEPKAGNGQSENTGGSNTEDDEDVGDDAVADDAAGGTRPIRFRSTEYTTGLLMEHLTGQRKMKW